MIQVSLKTDFDRMSRSLMTAAGDLTNVAARIALTRTVVAIRKDLVAALPEIFKKPTGFTVSSPRYKASTGESPSAEVYISDDAAKGLSPRKYLGPEIYGGPRGRKRSENALLRGGLIQEDQWIEPGAGMRLNAKGNIPSAAMVQILSRIKAFGEVGYQANQTSKSKKSAKPVKFFKGDTGDSAIFVGKVAAEDRARGIFIRLGGRSIRPLLWFARPPVYKPRFHFEHLVNEGVRKHWVAEMKAAIRGPLTR